MEAFTSRGAGAMERLKNNTVITTMWLKNNTVITTMRLKNNTLINRRNLEKSWSQWEGKHLERG